LGQVCGDSANGAWNTSEQFPIMIVSGGTIMHKMPEMNSRIDWIPLNYAAESIAKIMLATSNDDAHWNTEKTLKTAPVLGEAPSFNSELLGKYINYWRKEGFCN
jgi:thioester reductase-like protein